MYGRQTTTKVNAANQRKQKNRTQNQTFEATNEKKQPLLLHRQVLQHILKITGPNYIFLCTFFESLRDSS